MLKRFENITPWKALVYAAICILAALAAFCRLFGPADYAPELLGMIGLAALIALIIPALCLKRRPMRLSWLLGAFIAWAALSTAINRPAAMFRSWEHLLYFALALAAVSPLLMTPGLTTARKVLWRACVAAAYVSIAFEVYFWCQNIGIRPQFDFGFFINFMLASYIAAFVTVDALSRALLKARSRASVAGFLTVAMFALVIVVYKGSRMALIGCSAASIFVMVMALINRRYGRVIASLIMVGGAMTCIFSTTETTMVIHQTKLNANIHLGATHTRNDLWGARLREIKEAPILGIGFTSARHYTAESMEETPRLLQRSAEEPGSSLLSVGACTGLVGLTLLLWFNVRMARRLWHPLLDKRRWAMAAYWSAMLIFLWASAVTEGWMLYGGSFMFLAYWLATGNIEAETGNTEEQ